MRSLLAVTLCAGLSVSASAGVLTSNGVLDLYGSNYAVSTWTINDDSNASTTPRIFGAESMTFFNGTLYVADDHNVNQGDGQLVTYTPGASGDLSSPSRILMGVGPSGQRWGPEGMTINTSGSGYGSFAAGGLNIVGIETQGTDAFGIFDATTPGSAPTGIVNPIESLDDIAWVGSKGQFAAVAEAGGDASALRYFDGNTMADLGSSSPLIDGAKGITVISPAFATLLTGLSVSTSEALLVVSEFDGFAIYDTDGNAIGPALTFGDYLPITELESVAVDEINARIYLGDEAGKAIHVVTIPAPGSAAVLGLLAASFARRRR